MIGQLIVVVIVIFSCCHHQVTATSLQHCDDEVMNKDITGLSTKASHDSYGSDLALKGSKLSWKPYVQATVSWYASNTEDSGCLFTTLQFGVRFALRVVVKIKRFGSKTSKKIKAIKKSGNELPEKWIPSDVITIPDNAETIKIIIVPTTEKFNAPELRNVILTACCGNEESQIKSQPAVCKDIRKMDEINDIIVYASQEQELAKQMFTSGAQWSPSTHAPFYSVSAHVRNGRCSMSSAQFTVSNVKFVMIQIASFGNELVNFKEFNVHYNGANGDNNLWETIEVTLDNNLADSYRVQEIKLIFTESNPTSFQNDNDSTEFLLKLSNFKIEFCCDPGANPPPG